jgi:S1-C subfamily serine protease
VEGGTPAWQAGLQEGDVIVALDGKPVTGVDDLHRLLTDERVGRKVSVTVLRNGRKGEIDIVPVEAGARG